LAEVYPEIRFTEFGLGGEGFAVRVEDITDIILIPDITPVPVVDPSIIGLFNLRGVVVALIDICPKLAIQRGSRTVNSRVVVLQPSDEVSYAIWVDDVWDISSIPMNDIQSVPKGIRGESLLSGIYNRGTQAISVLNPAAIASLEDYAIYK